MYCCAWQLREELAEKTSEHETAARMRSELQLVRVLHCVCMFFNVWSMKFCALSGLWEQYINMYVCMQAYMIHDLKMRDQNLASVC